MAQLLESRSAPFKYGVFSNVFSASTAEVLLTSLEEADGWRLARKPFYEQYELSLRDAFFDNVAGLLTVDDLQAIIRAIEFAFGVHLEPRVEIVAHRLTPGQGIGLHNDSVPGWETHRLTLTLNRGFNDQNGGHLVFFNSRDSADIHGVFRPIHNSAVAFELTPRSYHAVSDVTSGVRHSLVFSFWRKSPALTASGSFDTLFDAGRKLLHERGLGEVARSGKVLTSHLAGTAHILHEWHCSTELCLAGLFHSAYGTRTFPLHAEKALPRAVVADTVGQSAEWLVYLFKVLTRADCAALARKSGSQPHVVKTPDNYLLVTSKQLRQLITLDLANSLEQIGRVDFTSEEVDADRRYFEELQDYLPPLAHSALSQLQVQV